MIIYFIQVNLETTIDEALKYFLRKINRVEYINQKKISFRFNDTKINFGDLTPLKELFGSLSTITTYIESDDQLSFNWTKEEEISFYKDKDTINNEIKELIKGIKDFQPNFEQKTDYKEFYNFLDEQKIRVVFIRLNRHKKESTCVLTLSNKERVENLIDIYHKKIGTNDGIFLFVSMKLKERNDETLFDVGLEDNSTIVITDD